MVRRRGIITLSDRMKYIDYANDFKIMRFGVVGVKVWLNQPKNKSYSYLFQWSFN